MSRISVKGSKSAAALGALLLLGAAPPPPPGEPVDLDVVTRIRQEAFQRSQVADVVQHLTDRIGARLTASPQLREANEWTREKLASWGLKDAHLETWGPFGNGWVLERSSVALLTPAPTPLVALPRAFSVGTPGPVRGIVVQAKLESEADFEAHRGKLRGKIVLTREAREVPLTDKPVFQRYSDAELLALAGFDLAEQGPRTPRFARFFAFGKALREFLAAEGALATLEPSSAEAGVLRVSGNAPLRPGDPALPALIMASDHYNRLVRMAAKGQAPELELDVKVRVVEGDGLVHNTIAEIPGTDLRHEVVMMGAHLDSWHGGTGATDNAAGVGVVMEAARILAAVGVKPRRTIRLGLWTGEEQGLLGSRAYVRQHLATRAPGGAPPAAGLPPYAVRDRGPLQPKPEHARFSAYFNMDNGAGRIRGIYAEGNAAAAPIFNAWLSPFHDLGARTVTLRHSGGSDHESFDEAGLPGFPFIQDRLEYETRTHHTNIDGFDRVIAADLMQNAAIVATFVYHAAMRDGLLPRKPLPRYEATPASPAPVPSPSPSPHP